MDCRQALTQLADHSATALSEAQTQVLIEHLRTCPECDEEWKAFQGTLIHLSAGPQALPTAEQSRRIWAACLEQISQDTERKRVASKFRFAPNWSWAALGGAAAIFGGVWLLAPRAATTGRPPTALASTQFDHYEAPPEPMTALVDHHAAMSFDAFNDHTGSTLISYRSTEPAPSSP